PPPRGGLPAPRHPHRGDGPLDGRPDAAPAAPLGRRAAVARPDRRRAARRGAHLARVGGAPDQQAPGPDRGPRGLPDPARRGHTAQLADGAAGGRPGACDDAHRRDRPGRGGVRQGARRGGRSLMRVAIAGAGAVGRSIAGELLENGHEVLLIDKTPTAISVERVPQAEWLLADACEITSLDEAALQRCNVVIAATGDDKVNLVVSLLAKTEYGVPRVVARVNNPKNEWLFNESWGVDVAVSTPRLMSALVEEAVSVGDLVRLLRFSHGDANLVELTLPEESALAGTQVGDVQWPQDTSLVTIIRGTRVLTPTREDSLEVGDELLFVAAQAREEQLEDLLSVRKGDAGRRDGSARHTREGAAGGSPRPPPHARTGSGSAAPAGRALPPAGRRLPATGYRLPATGYRLRLPATRPCGAVRWSWPCRGPRVRRGLRASARCRRPGPPRAPSRRAPPPPSPRTRRWAAEPSPGTPRSGTPPAGTA